jgi:hypothetical protein
MRDLKKISVPENIIGGRTPVSAVIGEWVGRIARCLNRDLTTHLLIQENPIDRVCQSFVIEEKAAYRAYNEEEWQEPNQRLAEQFQSEGRAGENQDISSIAEVLGEHKPGKLVPAIEDEAKR